MDHTFVDVKNLKSLEELFAFLVAGRVSVQTLIILQVKAIKVGIMPEDMNQRAANLITKLQDSCALYEQQMQETLELLPEDFDPKAVVSRLQATQMTKARSMLRKPKEKK